MSERNLRGTTGEGAANCRGGLREAVATIEDVLSGRERTRLEVFPLFRRAACVHGCAGVVRSVTGLVGGNYRGASGRTPSARLPERPPSVHVAGSPPRRGADTTMTCMNGVPSTPAALRVGELLVTTYRILTTTESERQGSPSVSTCRLDDTPRGRSWSFVTPQRRGRSVGPTRVQNMRP